MFRSIHMLKSVSRYYSLMAPKDECLNSYDDRVNEKIPVQTGFLAGKAMKVELSIAAFKVVKKFTVNVRHD